jgi:hypothetical protein
MKRIHKLKTFMLAATLVVASSCENFLDVNDTPNNVNKAEVNLLLPGDQIGIAFLLGNTIQNVDGLWMQHIAGTGTQQDPYDRYVVSPADFDNEWNLVYATLLDDLQEIITVGEAGGNFQHAGMAQVLKAYVGAIATDHWGEVPFSKALNYLESPKPAYDPQQEVYAQLIALVDRGIANLGKSNVLAASNGDLMYGGDIPNWLRAANSLKLKLYLQSRKKNPELSKTEINKLIAANNFISTNAQNFDVDFFTSSGSQNPLFQYNHLNRPNDQLMSTRYLDSAVALSDPRLPYFYTKAGGSYVTYDNGAYASASFTSPNRSRYGAYVVGNGTVNATSGQMTGAGAAPVRFITKSMVSFWLAEAALTLGTTGTPEVLFQQAIQDNFDDIKAFTGTADAGFTTSAATYIASRVAAFQAKTTTEGKLNVLIRDKWASSVGNAYEAYNDYRRTGYPRLGLAQNAAGGVTRIPVRWPYVQTEIQSNPDNVPTKAYPAGLLTPVWWM